MAQQTQSVCLFAVVDGGSLIQIAGVAPSGTQRALDLYVRERLLRTLPVPGASSPKEAVAIVGIVQQGQDEIADDVLPARVACLARLTPSDAAGGRPSVACFLLPATPASHETLDAFRGEIGRFCDGGRALLSMAAAPDAYEDARAAALSYLAPWYAKCVQFVGRCVAGYGDSLAAALHAGMRGDAMPECGVEKEDAARLGEALFVRRCECAAVDELFSQLAAQMRESPADAVKLYRACLQARSSVSKELGAAEKMLAGASASHHVLYQLFDAVRRSKARALLMAMLPRESEAYESIAALLAQLAAPKASAPLVSLL